jgi:hypothetical protein
MGISRRRTRRGRASPRLSSGVPPTRKLKVVISSSEPVTHQKESRALVRRLAPYLHGFPLAAYIVEWIIRRRST